MNLPPSILKEQLLILNLVKEFFMINDKGAPDIAHK